MGSPNRAAWLSKTLGPLRFACISSGRLEATPGDGCVLAGPRVEETALRGREARASRAMKPFSLSRPRCLYMHCAFRIATAWKKASGVYYGVSTRGWARRELSIDKHTHYAKEALQCLKDYAPQLWVAQEWR